jgi:DNA-binding GntR family transcriptional regulator
MILTEAREIKMTATSPALAGTDRRLSLVDDAYVALKAAIRDSVFPPGHQASAQELALRFGMSRTPIHEAILKLQEEGLVRILPKRGILICALVPDDIREIYQVIIAIEASAAESAAALPAPAREVLADALAQATQDMARALEEHDLDAWGRGDQAFHRMLVEGCGNSRFVRIMQTVNDQSHRARMLTIRLRTGLPRSTAEHLAIAGAIRSGDGRIAYATARQHRIGARDELLPLIKKLGFRHL